MNLNKVSDNYLRSSGIKSLTYIDGGEGVFVAKVSEMGIPKVKNNRLVYNDGSQFDLATLDSIQFKDGTEELIRDDYYRESMDNLLDWN